MQETESSTAAPTAWHMALRVARHQWLHGRGTQRASVAAARLDGRCEGWQLHSPLQKRQCTACMVRRRRSPH